MVEEPNSVADGKYYTLKVHYQPLGGKIILINKWEEGT